MERFVKDWLFGPTGSKFIGVIVGILVIVIAVRFLQRSIVRRIKDPEMRYRTRKFVSFLGYGVAVLLVIFVFSKQLGGLHVALGIAGAGVAFALQEVITSLAGWVALSFGGFYKTGDRIQLGGIRGDVIDIGILRTTVMECGGWVNGDLYNGRIVRIANSFVFKEPVFNYSVDFPFLWDEIIIPVKYESDQKLTREILKKVVYEIIGDYAVKSKAVWNRMVEKYKIEEAKVEPMVTIVANDNWVEFTVRYVVDYKARRSTKDLLFTRILEEFDKTEDRIRIASTSTDIRLVEAPMLDAGSRGKDKNPRAKI